MDKGGLRLKYKLSVIFLLFIGILSACGNEVDPSASNPKENLGEIYSLALGSIMEKDKGLDGGMEFIAIDMSNFEDFEEQDKQEVLDYFKDKYDIEVMDSTYEKLVEEGRYNPDTTALDGILLRLEKVKFPLNDSVVFEGSKFRSGLGAIGVEVTIQFENGKWTIKESKDIWIS